MMFSSLCCLSTVFISIGFISTDKVPVPDNIQVSSLDMRLQLLWDPPKNISNKLVTYTAELRGWSDFKTACLSVSSLSCDVTDNVTKFGTYRLRVRTEISGETSDWVETAEIAVDKITEISGPHVELRSRKGQTEVDITDPPLRKTNLRDVFGQISYLIRYWKEGDVTKREVRREQNRIMLPDVEPLVSYCVQVCVLFLNNKTSHFSNVTCVTNTASDEVQMWFIGVVLLVSFVVVFIAVLFIFLAVWYSYKMCGMMYPDTKLPEHLKQYLCERPQSSVLLSVPPKEKVDEVSIHHEVSPNKHQTDEPIRVQENVKDCWTAADTDHRDEDEAHILLMK